MALINVKDLPQSVALDRKAMQAIVGGARAGVRPVDLSQVNAGPPQVDLHPLGGPAAGRAGGSEATNRGGRIVDYPPGFGRDKPADKPTT